VDRRDLRIAEALLSPEYMIPLAREYGEGDPVRGARFAWREVRGLLREWVRHVRQRDKLGTDLDLSFSFKHLGIIGTYCEVIPVINEPWRDRALQSWDGPGVIHSKVEVSTGRLSYREINCCALRAISKALKRVPFANRAILDGRCWQRVSSELLLNFELRGDMHSVVFDADGKTDDWIHRKIKRALTAAKHIQRHELAWFGRDLSLKWAKTGLISSPAGAMVALLGRSGLDCGYAPLLPKNGIPAVITVCAFNPETQRVMITGSLDHRVMDGRTTSRFFNVIKEEMECELS
jgi:hypothetical protein